MSKEPSPLPYRDTKPVGAADFYFAINATFRFMLRRFGEEGLRRYWTDLGKNYYAPVAAAWKQHGLPGIAAYWQAFFAAEPGADVRVHQDDTTVVVEVESRHAGGHQFDGVEVAGGGIAQFERYSTPGRNLLKANGGGGWPGAIRR